MDANEAGRECAPPRAPRPASSPPLPYPLASLKLGDRPAGRLENLEDFTQRDTKQGVRVASVHRMTQPSGRHAAPLASATPITDRLALAADRTLAARIDVVEAFNSGAGLADLPEVLARLEANLIRAKACHEDEDDVLLNIAVNALVVDAYVAHRMVTA